MNLQAEKTKEYRMSNAYPVKFLPPNYADDDADSQPASLAARLASQTVWSSAWQDMARRKVAMISNIVAAMNTRK